MNTNQQLPDGLTPPVDKLVDKLVDGELADADRRALLARLDATPGAWRACALAFVEDQVLGEQLGALGAEASPRLQPQAPQPQPQAPKPQAVAASRAADRSPRPTARWYALAASVLVAFGLGGFVSQTWRSETPSGDAIVAAAPGGDALTAVPDPAPQPVVAENALAKGDDDGESVTFWVQDNGARRSFSAPLVDAEQLDRDLGLSFPSRVTPGMRRRLEGRGYQVSSRRRYAPLYMEGGQPLVVPVEDVQIIPVRGTEL